MSLKQRLAARVAQRARARKKVRRLTRQIRRLKAKLAARRKPPIITAAEAGLTGFQYLDGHKGHVYRGAGHYSAGPRAKDRADLIRLARSYHAAHRGGLAYEAVIADDGTILLGNPMDRKGAAVAMNNTGMVNTMVNGTTGDRMTEECKRSLRWLMDNWHTRKVPKRHRLPRPARQLDWRGHKEHPSQATACPGDMLADYKEVWK